MKKGCLLILLAAAAIIPATAQRRTARHTEKHRMVSKVERAPDSVSQAFQEKYPSVTGETWHKMASGHWYADFQQDSTSSKAEFTPDGQWVATRTALTQSQLPDTVVNAIQQKYPGSTIGGITHIERSDVAAYYEISLQVNGAEKDILANSDGTLAE